MPTQINKSISGKAQRAGVSIQGTGKATQQYRSTGTQGINTIHQGTAQKGLETRSLLPLGEPFNPQDEISRLRKDLNDLIAETYRNNFSAQQDFNKKCNFTTRLQIPSYTDLPTVGEVGEIISLNGVLYICSSNNTFTIV